jgi:hypothetical protein
MLLEKEIRSEVEAVVWLSFFTHFLVESLPVQFGDALTTNQKSILNAPEDEKFSLKFGSLDACLKQHLQFDIGSDEDKWLSTAKLNYSITYFHPHLDLINNLKVKYDALLTPILSFLNVLPLHNKRKSFSLEDPELLNECGQLVLEICDKFVPLLTPISDNLLKMEATMSLNFALIHLFVAGAQKKQDAFVNCFLKLGESTSPFNNVNKQLRLLSCSAFTALYKSLFQTSTNDCFFQNFLNNAMILLNCCMLEVEGSDLLCWDSLTNLETMADDISNLTSTNEELLKKCSDLTIKLQTQASTSTAKK